VLSARQPLTHWSLLQMCPELHALSSRQPVMHICEVTSQIWPVEQLLSARHPL
jgi:hypothetical protein